MFRSPATTLRSTAMAAALAASPVAADADSMNAPAVIENTAQCAAPVAPTGPLAGWAAPHGKVTAAAKADAVGMASLSLGKAADVALVSTSKIAYAAQPAKSGGMDSFGGIVGFDVPEAGTYRVALNSRAWIDVVVSGAAAKSVAHSHGPACSGVTKMVDYALKPGRHLLQVAANGAPSISVMVVRLP